MINNSLISMVLRENFLTRRSEIRRSLSLSLYIYIYIKMCGSILSAFYQEIVKFYFGIGHIKKKQLLKTYIYIYIYLHTHTHTHTRINKHSTI